LISQKGRRAVHGGLRLSKKAQTAEKEKLKGFVPIFQYHNEKKSETLSRCSFIRKNSA